MLGFTWLSRRYPTCQVGTPAQPCLPHAAGTLRVRESHWATALSLHTRGQHGVLPTNMWQDQVQDLLSSGVSQWILSGEEGEL